MFLSFTARYLVNAEALNGVGSVGNISRHRNAPLVVKVDNGYAVKYFPVVSGESIAHGYQELLAEIGRQKGLPVGKRSANGEFLKFTDEYLLQEEGITPPKDLKDARRVEVEIMLKDLVSDVGGFLYAGKGAPIKRTSAFQVSYMVPAYGVSAEVAALESQMHVRYSQSAFKAAKGEDKQGQTQTVYQIPYNVDVGSALYSVTFNIDLDWIATPANAGDKVKGEEDLEKQRKARQEVALLAFARLFENLEFGAKKSRFLPQATLEEAVITLTDSPFVVTPSVASMYAKSTADRLAKMKSLGLVKPVLAGAVNTKGPSSDFKEFGSVAEAVEAVIKAVKG